MYQTFTFNSQKPQFLMSKLLLFSFVSGVKSVNNFKLNFFSFLGGSGYERNLGINQMFVSKHQYISSLENQAEVVSLDLLLLFLSLSHLLSQCLTASALNHRGKQTLVELNVKVFPSMLDGVRCRKHFLPGIIRKNQWVTVRWGFDCIL